MMKKDIFNYKILNKAKLLKNGFARVEDVYKSSIPIMNGEFIMNVEVIAPNIVNITTIETETNEPYTLHLTNETGTFVGQVRSEYENILSGICENCFDDDVFKSPQAKKLIKYIYEKYGDELEFLWDKSPDAAIVRRKDTKKWYIVFMTIKKARLGFDTDETVEVIDLHALQDEIPELLRKGNIFPGYHMNKKHWITIILDGTVQIVEIYKLLDKSYELAMKRGMI